MPPVLGVLSFCGTSEPLACGAVGVPGPSQAGRSFEAKEGERGWSTSPRSARSTRFPSLASAEPRAGRGSREPSSASEVASRMGTRDVVSDKAWALVGR